VSGVSLSVCRGETLGIVGESGSGKSTLLRMVLRLIEPSEGSIAINGADVWKLHGSQLKAMRRQVQPIFQNPSSSFNPRQTIRSILMAPLEVHGIGTTTERRDRVRELLGRVGLDPSVEARLPHQLSGGQKQRVAIARAVILGPTVVLADEPTSALDVSVQAQVLRLFSEIKRDLGLTTIFVSHNLAVIRQVSDRVAVMRHGEVIEEGPVNTLFDAPLQAYTRDLIAAVPDPAFARRT
jgi:peptide/nickel transport system ATP-binding protein